MAEKNTKPVQGPGGRGPKGPRPKVENPGKLFMRLLAYIMKNYAVHCILVVICIFITVLASVQGTWFMQTLIDGYILPLIGQADPDFSGLLHAIMRVSIFYLIGALASYIYTRIMVNVSQGTLKNLRDDMFTHMEELPIRYFDTHYHGDIMSTYTNDIDTLRQMISQSMPQFLNSIITIVSVFVSMLLLNVPLTIVTLLMIGVTLFATKKIGALSAKYFIAQQKDIATVNGYIEEMMNGQKVVKVFTHEEESIENFNRLNDQLFHSADNANKFGNILMPVNAQIGNISYVLCALVGGVLALNGVGGFTLGKLASFLTYNKSFSQPVNQLSMQLNNIVMALAGSERIFKLLDEEPEVDNGYVTLVRARKENGQIVESKERTGMWAWKHTHQADGSVDYIELKGDVVFDDVNFGYNPDKIVLHNVDLYATPGQKIAFVGSTGAGKTTITNLINRFYDIQDGKIRYDGINGPILEGVPQGFHMVPAAKGRRNAGCRTKGSTGFISERQMMNRHFARNGHTSFLCLANDIHRPFTCNMSDVDMGSCILGNDGIAGNCHIFCNGRNARHTQPCRYGAFVHIARMIHVFLNGMDNERLIKGIHITGRLARMKRRIIRGSSTKCPSSENAIAPRMAISPISESSLPFSPFVIAPMTSTWT